MNRRQLMFRAALGAAAAACSGALPATAAEVAHIDYSAAAYKQALESGKPMLLDFFAPW